MVSRRKILSRSRDDLTYDNDPPHHKNFEEDTWYSQEKLYKDHVQEILRKWDAIDDEIWAKVIVMERNRRVAKAYARAPVLSINGGSGGFDGFRLGMNGFANPMRDPKTQEFKENIGSGAKVKMDESGNILIKRLSKSCVYVKNTMEDSAVSNDLITLSGGLIDLDRPFRVFDMRKFQQNVNRELRRSNPDRTRLESQCVTSISFVKNEPELLDSPIWILIINIVALEMLKAKLPPVSRIPLYQMQNTSSDHRRFPVSGSSDEDPYSFASGNISSGSSKSKRESEKSGLLHKKETDFFVPQNWSATQDRRRDRSRDNFLDEPETSNTLKPRGNNRRKILKKTEEKSKIVDDPYYCGFTARVPQYIQQAQAKTSREARTSRQAAPERVPKYREPGVLLGPGGVNSSPGGHPRSDLGPGGAQSAPNLSQLPQVQPYWWHSRLYPDHSIPQGMKSQLGYHSPYFDRHPRFNTPNEFSSLQLNGGHARSGLLPTGLQEPQSPPAAQTQQRTKKRFPGRKNIFKSST